MLIKKWNKEGMVVVCESFQTEDLKKAGYELDECPVEDVKVVKEVAKEVVAEEKPAPAKRRKVEPKKTEKGPDIVL